MNGTWKTVEIHGKTADVYEPETPPTFGLLHLHGHGLDTLRDRQAFTRWFDAFKMVCVCPHGQRSWWSDRICVEFDAQMSPERFILKKLLPFMREQWKLPPRGVGIQGISMGGQGALRIAFKYPDIFPVVAAISPAIDYYERYGQGLPLDDMYTSREQCRQDTVLLHIHPSRFPPHIFFCIDPDDREWYRGNDRLDEKLNALGIPHELDLTTQAGGHSWDYFNFMAERSERFLQTGLERESRRLL